MDAIIDRRDFYLKLASESEMTVVLAPFYGTDDDGHYGLITHTSDYDIDVVGILYEPTGNTLTDDEGFPYPEVTPLPGWHINIRLANDAMRETVEALDASHGVTPNSPSRVWL